MPQCIFCERPTTSEVSKTRSVCLECLVAYKRLELHHSKEVMARLMPEDFNSAIRRVIAFDPKKATPEDLDELEKAIETVKKSVSAP